MTPTTQLEQALRDCMDVMKSFRLADGQVYKNAEQVLSAIAADRNKRDGEPTKTIAERVEEHLAMGNPRVEGWDAMPSVALSSRLPEGWVAVNDLPYETVEAWINGIGSGMWANGKLTLSRDELAAVIRSVASMAVKRAAAPMPKEG